ncbi:MAG TPA: amino acid permease [Pseudonocardiaceae bacterium]|nr:amino acid permease [Pseudonocardiaceae bacterium]
MTRQLRERSGTTDSVIGGLGAMLGAGVFIGLAPAAGLAGSWVLVGLAVAALAAICTACSVTDLARAYPGIGGGYRYTRELLGRWPGRMVGGVGVLGRVAAVAAVAGCFGQYVLPARPTAAALVVVVLVVLAEALGLRLPPVAKRVLLAVVLLALALVAIACFAVPAPVQVSGPLPAGLPGANNPAELLPTAGLLFFAFVGGQPARAEAGRTASARSKVVVPMIILVALGSYLAVCTAVLRELGPTRLALSPDPLRDALAAANASALDPVLTAGVFAATIGVLFALVGGTRDTVRAMAEAGDLPGPLRGRTGIPVLGIGCVVAVLVLPPVAAIQLASTCLLFAAAFTNAAARLLERHERAWPTRTACFGLGLSVLLVVAMPPVALAVAVLALAVGAGIGPLCALTRRRTRRIPESESRPGVQHATSR